MIPYFSISYTFFYIYCIKHDLKNIIILKTMKSDMSQFFV